MANGSQKRRHREFVPITADTIGASRVRHVVHVSSKVLAYYYSWACFQEEVGAKFVPVR